jgi:predicted transcriptional regulator of viral defense system
MRRRQWDTTLYALAEEQAGYFTAAQARAAALHQVRLAQLHQRGDIERLTRGVYRLTRYPISPLGQYMEAALWPQVRRPDACGVISHESALAIYGLSDASPAKVHVTLPTNFRIRRAVPKRLALHDGRRTDQLTFDKAERLEHELLGTKSRRQARHSKSIRGRAA